MQSPLVIIDMQTYFPASNDKDVQAAIVREINAAKNRGDWIYVVEYIYCGKKYGETQQPILDAVQGYRQYRLVKKNHNDGSREIAHALQRDIVGTIDNIFVCGVNTDCCVLYSAMGLAKMFPATKVAVIFDACNSLMYPRQESLRLVARMHLPNCSFVNLPA